MIDPMISGLQDVSVIDVAGFRNYPLSLAAWVVLFRGAIFVCLRVQLGGISKYTRI